MQIVDIVESTRPISLNIRNAFIDFPKLTLSLVAVVTCFVRSRPPGMHPKNGRMSLTGYAAFALVAPWWLTSCR